MTAPVTVTQADREAAADYWQTFVARPGECIVANQTRKGGMDQGEAVQAFARHRQQAEAASNAQVAELREALDSIDVWLSDTLSGRVQPDPATYKQWLIDAIVEARGRARKALTHAKATSDAEGV